MKVMIKLFLQMKTQNKTKLTDIVIKMDNKCQTKNFNSFNMKKTLMKDLK